MNGLFIVTKKGIVQEARNQKNPDFPLLTCNIILRSADNSFGRRFAENLHRFTVHSFFLEGYDIIDNW